MESFGKAGCISEVKLHGRVVYCQVVRENIIKNINRLVVCVEWMVN